MSHPPEHPTGEPVMLAGSWGVEYGACAAHANDCPESLGFH